MSNDIKIITHSRERDKLQKVATGDDYDSLLMRFLSSQDIKPKSRDTYSWAMTQYFRWIAETARDLKSLTPADIVSFKNHLLEKGLSQLTVSAYLTAVRQFYNWTEICLLYPNIARSVRAPRGKKGFKKMHLSPLQAGELLEYLKTRSARDYALVNLILRTGLRTIEVSRADIGDITVKKGRRVLKVWGKGLNEKDNIVILNEPVWIPIRDYLEGRVEKTDDQPLFVTDGKGHRGCRMSARLIQHTCKEAMRAIGLEGHEYSPHSLRHTTAVMILRSGGDWKDVQRVLRHSSPTVSQIYTASIEDEVHLEKNPEGLLDTAF